MPSPVLTLRSLRHGSLKQLDPLWLVLGRIYCTALRLAPGSGSATQWIGGYGPFKMNPMFAFSDFAHWGGGHNRGFACCVESCRGVDCVLDVGAHIGLLALPISQILAPGGRLYAFEPAAANKRMLAEHLALNGCDNVEAIDSLVGSDDRPAVPFYEQEEPTGINSIVGGGSRDDFARTERPQVSLDSFCRARDLAPQVIKIDVEGAELGVIEGARETLARHRPTIFLSVHPSHIAALGRSTAELSDLIDALGYACCDIEGRPVEEFRLDEYKLVPKA